MGSEISRLRVGDEDFLVASMIERCPKTMMLRELVQNAIEAAAKPAGNGARLGCVEIGRLMVGGARKLAIWNTGPGMTADELHRMCDIASSIGKVQGLDGNFGMGAKVATLPSNQLGIRYRSCRDGEVHQVIIGKRDGAYGRLRVAPPDGQPAEVIDVTATARQEGCATDVDWTEVVLLGNEAAQDTLADPYGHAPDVGENWIAEDLYHRFFRLPAGITLSLQPAVHRRAGAQLFVPVGHRLRAAFERHEAVTIEQGVVVHFLYDPADPEEPVRPRSERDALQASESGVAVVHKGEIYDARRGDLWVHDAPLFGFAFGARHFSVFIELPDDYPVLPETYRQFLRWRENAQHQVVVGHFSKSVMAARPAWLLDLLKQFAPDARHVEVARGEMGDLFARLKIRRRWWPPTPAAEPEAPGAPAALAAGPEAAPEYEVAPQVITIREADDARMRGLDGVAARFYGETHQLFMNFSYPAVEAMRRDLEASCEPARTDQWDAEAMRRAAQTVAELAITRQVCRKLVFALAKRDSWGAWQVDQATSPYSLTLAADDHSEVFSWAREMLRRLAPAAPAATRARTLA